MITTSEVIHIPPIISINTCCFIKSVDIIINIDIIVMNNLKYLFEFFILRVYIIHKNLIAQCSDGKQFKGSLSTKNTILVIILNMSFPLTVGLLTVVGHTINMIFAIIVINT